PSRREGRAIRLSRPQGEEAHFPRAVDPAHQCGGARERPHLWAADRWAEEGRYRGRPQGARRYRRARAANLQGSRRGCLICRAGLGPEAAGHGSLAMSTLELYSLKSELLHAIAEANDLDRLEEVRVAALGRKGRVSELMQALGSLPPEERKAYGQVVNSLKDSVGEALEAKRRELTKTALGQKLATERADVTLPVREGPLAEGRVHPVSQVTDEITEIFAEVGFSIAEGPDIETDFNNFTALNIPPEHPARQDHDTFYLPEAPDGTRPVLRTHTSPVQIRTMLREKPPLRIIAPGRVYRSDSDQTHTPMFHQVEGLAIDEETHLGHLKWVLEEFCKAFFEVPQVKMRFRASYFPFTEPSMEVDIGYAKVGDEFRIGEGDDWLEILVRGMMHPHVLKNALPHHDP